MADNNQQCEEVAIEHEIVDFVATRSELTILVKETYKHYLDCMWASILHSCAAKAQGADITYRLAGMKEALGEEEYVLIIKKVFTEFREGLDPYLRDNVFPELIDSFGIPKDRPL